MGAARTDKLVASLALARVPGVGAVNFHRLVDAFGSPAAVFGARYDDYLAVEGIGDERARALAGFNAWDEVTAELDRAAAAGLACTAYGFDEYPPALAAIYDPPPILYYRGDWARLTPVAVAAVGTRRPTPYGEEVAAHICRGLAEAGVTVVSGMARGIDSCAHRAALAAGGVTVAVLGCGADVVYPEENATLYADIAARGLVVAEFPPGAPPDARNFPRRNRVIAGLAAGVVVLEAGEKSGALITARLAAAEGRDCFAVPGSIFSPASEGCRRLINGGAVAVASAADILRAVIPGREPAPGEAAALPLFDLSTLGADERALLELVGGEPADADELAAQAGWVPTRAAAALLNLELDGLIEKIPGNRYRRVY
jgi:DNA processing protein